MDDQFLQLLNWQKAIDNFQSGKYLSLSFTAGRYLDIDPDTNEIDDWNPLALAAKENSKDNFTWQEAMNNVALADGFLKAAGKEIDTLQNKMNCWDIVDREEWMNVLPRTWAFRCKHYPDGSIRKLKGRFCARGDKQLEGVNFFETFAPVVQWQTVWLMLILSVILNLATTQVDYTSTFIHALIDRDPNWDNMTPEEQQRSGVYVQMPRGFEEQGQVYV